MIDKKAYQKMDYALCLLGAHADGKDSGCIINSFHQVTSSFPAKFTIAVNRENVTAAAVEQAGSFFLERHAVVEKLLQLILSFLQN